MFWKQVLICQILILPFIKREIVTTVLVTFSLEVKIQKNLQLSSH